MKLSIVDEQIILSPVFEEILSLDDRLAKFDSKRHGGEEMVTAKPLGAEKW